jgi:hypothetical protein
MGLTFVRILLTAGALLAGGFSIVTAIRAYRSRIQRRWLWILISLLGTPVTTMNWSTGEVRTRALSVLLFSAGFLKPGPNAPWFVDVAFPLGAFLFLGRRKKLLAAARPLLAEDELQ